MMSEAQTGCENSEYEERLRRRLVLDVVVDWVWQEQSGLEVDLWQEQSKEDGGVGGLTDGGQVSSNAKLRDGHRCGANVLGTVDAEGDWQGVQSHGSVTLDGLEVVHNGNAQSSDGVQDWAVQ